MFYISTKGFGINSRIPVKYRNTLPVVYNSFFACFIASFLFLCLGPMASFEQKGLLFGIASTVATCLSLAFSGTLLSLLTDRNTQSQINNGIEVGKIYIALCVFAPIAMVLAGFIFDKIMLK